MLGRGATICCVNVLSLYCRYSALDRFPARPGPFWICVDLQRTDSCHVATCCQRAYLLYSDICQRFAHRSSHGKHL